jgi:hypothetical protein
MKANVINIIALVGCSFCAGAWIESNSGTIDFKTGCMIFCVILTIHTMRRQAQIEEIKRRTLELKQRQRQGRG